MPEKGPEYKLITPFTGPNTPPATAGAFWEILFGQPEFEKMSPAYPTPAASVIYHLQKMGMPRHAECEWVIGCTPASEQFYRLATSRRGCEDFLDGVKSNDPSYSAAYKYAKEIGYNVFGPWIFLTGPKNVTVKPVIEAVEDDGWIILSRPCCHDSALWELALDILETTPCRGVAWDGEQVLAIQSNFKKIRRWK